MKEFILTCNAGSTNSKLALFDAETLELVQKAQTSSAGEISAWLSSLADGKIIAIGHRVVHGGGVYTHPEVLNDAIIKELEKFIPLAPLHQPVALKLIADTRKLYPDIVQIACFDTAFHHTIEPLEIRLPLPKKYNDAGVRKYGFHGLSYEYIASVLPQHLGELARGRVIVAHLGGGASMCAMKNLRSVASTMGFSTLDGLMMSTRPGALDAGVVLYLLEQEKMTVEEVSALLYKNSGLLGVSGISADMKELLASNAAEAEEAVELYCYLAAKQLVGLIVPLGGLDALVFTGGIGENSEIIREKICGYVKFLGDIPVHHIKTNEELVIARGCKAI